MSGRKSAGKPEEKPPPAGKEEEKKETGTMGLRRSWAVLRLSSHFLLIDANYTFFFCFLFDEVR